MAESTRWCERCKAPIPLERVEALPETRVCVKCAQALGGSEFEVTVVSENLAKSGSLRIDQSETLVWIIGRKTIDPPLHELIPVLRIVHRPGNNSDSGLPTLLDLLSIQKGIIGVIAIGPRAPNEVNWVHGRGSSDQNSSPKPGFQLVYGQDSAVIETSDSCALNRAG
jgi:hypothetical protein